jgi:hypothetical protein
MLAASGLWVALHGFGTSAAGAASPGAGTRTASAPATSAPATSAAVPSDGSERGITVTHTETTLGDNGKVWFAGDAAGKPYLWYHSDSVLALTDYYSPVITMLSGQPTFTNCEHWQHWVANGSLGQNLLRVGAVICVMTSDREVLLHILSPPAPGELRLAITEGDDQAAGAS